MSAATASRSTTATPSACASRPASTAGRSARNISSQGKPCPVVIVCGPDPLLYLSAGNEVGLRRLRVLACGGHRGVRSRCSRSELHGLPMPAQAEIVLEGEVLPDLMVPEGPFGEWTGYYAGAREDDPAVRVRRVYHRDDRSSRSAAPSRPPFGRFHEQVHHEVVDDLGPGREGRPLRRARRVVPRSRRRTTVQRHLDQASLPGHAKQAAFLVAGAHAGNFANRFVVVVDDDIDPDQHLRRAVGDEYALRPGRPTSTSTAGCGRARSIR